MSALGPSSELASRLATRREERDRQEINRIFHDLERRLRWWRSSVRIAAREGWDHDECGNNRFVAFAFDLAVIELDTFTNHR